MCQKYMFYIFNFWQHFPEIKEGFNASFIKTFALLIVVTKGINILIFQVFQYNTKYGAKSSAEFGGK